MVYLTSRSDLELLTQNGGGCAHSHYPWAVLCKPLCEYFFVLMNPKNDVGTILFCKDRRWKDQKHPQDTQEWREELHKKGMRIAYGSATYDYLANSLPNRKPEEIVLAEAKRRYENCKARALKAGPLGPKNPHKQVVDDANKYVTACQGALEKKKLADRVHSGMEFAWNGVDLFILQAVGRGVDYDGSNTRYTEKCLEFMKEST